MVMFGDGLCTSMEKVDYSSKCAACLGSIRASVGLK